jgi:hypothetical protein
MTAKHLHTIRFDGHTVTLVETRSHRLFCQHAYAGDCVGDAIRVNPHASDFVRRAVAAYAGEHGLAMR